MIYNTKLCTPTVDCSPLSRLLKAEVCRVGSQDHLAQLIGIGRSTLQRAIAGNYPRMDVLRKIATYFRVEVYDLYNEDIDTAFATLDDRIFRVLDELKHLIEAKCRNREK